MASPGQKQCIAAPHKSASHAAHAPILREHTSSALLLAAIGAWAIVAPAIAEAQTSSRSRFYDFSDMMITPQTQVPGMTLIFGEEVGRSRCQQDDPDEFRVCIGEVRDRFSALPKGGAPALDVALVVVGTQAAGGLSDAIGGLADLDRDGWVNVEAGLYPHPALVPNAPKETQTWPRTFGKDAWTHRGRDITRALTMVRSLVRVPSGLSYLNVAVRSGDLIRAPFRPDARLLVLIVASQDDPWGGAAELARALDQARGAGRWTAHVLCLQSNCTNLQPLLDASAGHLEPVTPRDLRDALYAAGQRAAREVNRWTLSQNPTTTGYMEVRVDKQPLPSARYSYDPFERRVRVSDSVLNADNGSEVEVWYFPFHPSQVLAQVCPAAIRRDGNVQGASGDHGGALPCKGWMADELQGPEPAKIVDVFFDGVLANLRVDGAAYGAGLAAFLGPFRERGVDGTATGQGSRPAWRAGAFRVVVVQRGRSTSFSGEADAVVEWEASWNPEELQTLGWRILSRTIRIPISGMPIRFDSLQVFLNGRAIEPTTRDGAGYVMKGGALYLDVAAPIHLNSHLFAVYRHDLRGKRR